MPYILNIIIMQLWAATCTEAYITTITATIRIDMRTSSTPATTTIPTAKGTASTVRGWWLAMVITGVITDDDGSEREAEKTTKKQKEVE